MRTHLKKCMKNRKSFKRLATLIATSAFFALALSACNIPAAPVPSTPSVEDRIKEIYEMYRASTSNPLTYEEWLESIRGATGEPGHTPVITIGNDGYWYIDGVSTGIRATGAQGNPGEKGKDGTSIITGRGAPSSNLGNEGDSYIDLDNWDFYVKTANGWGKVGNIKGGQGDQGQGNPGNDGKTPYIGNNGNWWIDGQDLGIKAQGEQGVSITNITFVGSEENVDTYRITFSNGQTFEYSVTNGVNGKAGNDGTSLRTGTGVPTSDFGNVGDSYINLSTWDFYVKTANGWVLSGNIKGESGSGGGAETPVYHSVTFDPNGGIMPEGYPNPSTVKHGDSMPTLPIPTRQDYQFTGWFSGDTVNDGQFTVLTPVTRDLTLYASWNATAETYTVTLHYGHNQSDESISLRPGKYSLSVLDSYIKTISGYTFSYWAYSDGVKIEDEFTVSSNIVINAVYVENPVTKYTFTIIYDNGQPNYTAQLEEGYEITKDSLRDPTREGYKFLGYVYSESGAAVTFPIKMTKNITIKATWEKDTTSVHNFVVYPENGGEPQTFQYNTGDVIRESPYVPTYEGHTLQGYQDYITGDAIVFPFTMPDNDVSIKAVWKENTPVQQFLTLDIFASNDFHGAIEEKIGTDSYGNDYYELGLAKFGSYFKEQGDNENTLLLDQGDSWQGSIYSNYNYGNLVNDVMNYAGFDARTIGNHDFDWGIDKVAANTARAYNGYNMDVLGANIYDYDFETKTFGQNQQSTLGKVGQMYTLENGLKVGVVGVIGEDQITSIDSSLVETIGFKNHIDTIKSEATRLRTAGADIVVVSAHVGEESEEDIRKGASYQLKTYGLENYVDFVLCGHTHRNEIFSENGLTYAQFGKNGRNFGHVQLSYDTSTGKVDQSKTAVTRLTSYSLEDTEVDPQIQVLINASMQECNTYANETLHTNFNGTFRSDNEAPNLMCEAIYEAAVAQGQTDIDFVNVNYARANLNAGSTVQMKDLFNAFPFDNKVYIVTVTGDEIAKEIVPYNYSYIANTSKTFDVEKEYKIAVLDYLVNHTDSSRYYNWYPYGAAHKITTLNGTYREMLASYLRAHSNEEMAATNFTSDQAKFNRNNVVVNCKLTLMKNDGTDGVYQTLTLRYKDVISRNLPADPTRDGYTFGGWYLDAACSRALSSSYYITGNISLYAKWTENGGGQTQAIVLTRRITLSDFASEELVDYNKNDPQPKSGRMNLTASDEEGSNSESFLLSYSYLQKSDTYGQFDMNPSVNSNILITAPNGYKVTALKAEIFNGYDNLSYQSADGSELNESSSTYTDGDGKYRLVYH